VKEEKQNDFELKIERPTLRGAIAGLLETDII